MRSFYRWAALLLALTIPTLAAAHGPTRQKVTLTTDLAAPPAEVWEAIGNFQDMSWLPLVFSTEGEGGNEIDATRVLTLGEEGGPQVHEVLYKYDAEKMTYSYRITEVAVEVLPVTNYSSHLTVKPLDGGGSKVEWRGAFYRGYPLNDPPPELNDEAAIAAVSEVYKAGLDNLADRFGTPWASLPALVLSLAVPIGAAGDTAFVTNQNGDTLSVLDLTGGTEEHRLPLPGQPAGIAVTADAIFTVSPDSKTVRRLDAGASEVLAEITLDGGPMGVAADPARGRIFVTDWYNARLWEIDAGAMTVRRTLATGATPAGLDVSADGHWLATADRDSDAVSLFDLTQDDLPRRSVTVGTRPFGLRFAPDGRLFVANVGTNDVSVVDPVQGTVLGTIPVGERPYGVSFAKGHGFVTNQYADTVSVFDLGTLDVVETLEVGEYPDGIDVTGDGATVVVTNWFSNTVTLIDAATLTVSGEIDTGDGPRAFGRFIRP